MIVREYFTDIELRCRCGCGLLPPEKSVERLYALRILLGVPLKITSAARCRRHNKKCGGKSGSIHLPYELRSGQSALWRGGAFDIIADYDLQVRIIAAGMSLRFFGFGIAKNFIHIDDAERGKIVSWRY